MSKSVKLTTPNQEALELPVLEASIGHDVVDIRALTKNTGLFSFDPGFVSTASCESKITYIDGDKGLLYYRGYPIEQLAEKSDYLEVCYLLIYGELPTPEQKKEFDATVSHHTMVHEQLTWFFRGFRRDAHPMAMMVGVVGALSAFYQDSLDITNPEHRKIAIYRLISKIPTIAAMCYRYSNGLPFNYPKNNRVKNTNLIQYWPARSTASLFCMPITSKMRQLQPYVWPVLPARIRLPVSQPVSLACGVLHTAVQTKPC